MKLITTYILPARACCFLYNLVPMPFKFNTKVRISGNTRKRWRNHLPLGDFLYTNHYAAMRPNPCWKKLLWRVNYKKSVCSSSEISNAMGARERLRAAHDIGSSACFCRFLINSRSDSPPSSSHSPIYVLLWLFAILDKLYSLFRCLPLS